MQSSGGWTSPQSLNYEQSVDSGSGTDAFSLINANPEISETSYPGFDAITNMALPLGTSRSSSENIPPVRPAVVNWVQEQSQHDQPSKDSSPLQRARVDGSPPRAGQAQQASAKAKDDASHQEGYQPAKKVYDIATLLRLKETQSAVPVMLRVKPEAIAGEYYDYPASQASRNWADIWFQRTSSSIWELQPHVEYQRAPGAFPTSPISLLESQRNQDT